MSRSQSCRRKAVARLEAEIVEFNQSRADPVAFQALIRRLAASPRRVWPFAELAASRSKPLDFVERVLIQEVVGPHLTRMAPISVQRQNPRTKKADWLRSRSQ